MTESSSSKIDRAIGFGETQRWKPGQFRRQLVRSDIRPPIEDVTNQTFEGPLIGERNIIIQNDPENFTEFDDPQGNSGFTAAIMRRDGCGVSALYMSLGTLLGEKFNEKYRTVGGLAKNILVMHRNDHEFLGKRKIGTPVFNTKSGWYHDALLYQANELGVQGYRFEYVDFWDVALNFIKEHRADRKVLAIASVDSSIWFQKSPERESGSHLLVINGVKTESGKPTEIRVTDPYLKKDSQPIVNSWVKASRIEYAFKRKVMFLTI